MTAHDIYTQGRWDVGEGPAFSKSCPASGAIVWEGNAASRQQVLASVAFAKAAQRDWARRPQAERTSVIEAYGREIKSRSPAIAEIISREMGKALWDSEAEAASMAAKVSVSVAAQTERAGEREDTTPFGSARLSHRPHGVMAVFGPFNFPGHLPNGHIVPALLAGNACVFKPSELAPGVARIMVEAFEAAGLPPGVLEVVNGGRETGQALIDTDISGVLFTGSARTGLHFHKHFAGRPDVILALEMGGNNPLIVWDPADLAAAADIIAQSAFLTTGQRCSCARRLILPGGSFGDQVIEAVVERAKGLRIGTWNEPDIFMGPLVCPEARSAALSFQSGLLHRGARPALALTGLERGGGFVTPGIVDVSDASDVPDDELFGPLLQVIRVETFDDAIAAANATRFGLAAGLVSENPKLWDMARSEIRAGILNWNRPTVGASGTMPFGGPGLSGNFRPGAYYAADYCAWPQASQIASEVRRQSAPGFTTG